MTTYRVRTWDGNAGDDGNFTPQDGLSVPSHGLSLWQVRTAIRELRQRGYPCDRVRDPDGGHQSSDPAVLIEVED